MSNIPELPAKGESIPERPSRARYNKVHAALDLKWRRRELKSDRMMREVVEALWDTFGGSPYSWCGFYLVAPSGRELILGPHRDTGPGGPSATPPQEGRGGVSKPALSPIAMSGVRGKAAQSGRPVIAADVKSLGGAAVEPAPQTASEIALPVFDHAGRVWAVFVADSERSAAFDEMDQRWLERILKSFQEVGKPE